MKVYKIGQVSGTIAELAHRYEVSENTMRARVMKFFRGEIGVAKVLYYGRVNPARFGNGESGNVEWWALGDRVRTENFDLLQDLSRFEREMMITR